MMQLLVGLPAVVVPADSDAESDRFSDVSDDSDMFHVEVDPRRAFVTAEDRDLERIMALKAHLREYPLLPPDAARAGSDFVSVETGARLPTCHCAFKGCGAYTTQCFDDEHWGMEKWLFGHLCEVQTTMAAFAEAKKTGHDRVTGFLYF